MSKILSKCGEEWLKAENLRRLKEITNLGFSEIKDRIKKDKPVAEFILFHNDREEIKERLLKLIDTARKRNLEFGLFEIAEVENLDRIENTRKLEISFQTLQNILSNR